MPHAALHQKQQFPQVLIQATALQCSVYASFMIQFVNEY